MLSEPLVSPLVDRLDELDHSLVFVGARFGEHLSGREQPGVAPVRAGGQETQPVDQGLQGRVADAPCRHEFLQ